MFKRGAFAPLSSQSLQHRQQRLRLRPPGVIGVRFSIGDTAIAGDDEPRRQRQRPAIILVELRQIEAEPLLIQGDQRVGGRR